MRTLVLPVALSIAFVLLPLGASWSAQPAKRFTPPVTFENRKGVPDPQVWFARESKTGRWCAFDRATLERQAKRDEIRPGESGWARFDAHGLQSVTYAQESEDAYSEDRYFVGPVHEVERMVRTGHYINDPWVSVTFEPDASGRLRLTPASKAIVQKMDASGWETYFVNWDHFSKLRQLPFGSLLDRQNGTQIVSGC
jgi:hypothetical protein